MSSIGDVKRNLASASDSADEARVALVSAKGSIEQAIDVFVAAASGSRHHEIEEILGAYLAAATVFGAAVHRLNEGQRDANSYAAGLG